MGWLAANATIVAVLLTVVPTGLAMLGQRRSPQSALGWLLALILLPYLVVPAFWAFGFRKRRAGFPELAFDAAGASVGGASDGIQMPVTTFERLGAPPARAGNALTLLTTGEGAYDALMKLVDKAVGTLDVMFYLIADDAVGRAFVEALTARAWSGLRVRLMIDRLGGFVRPRSALRSFVEAGGQLCYTSPFLHKLSETRLNLRNHRKMVIADGRSVFAGGMNVGSEYIGPALDPGRFIDLSFVLSGPAAGDYAAIYAADWCAAGGSSDASKAAPAGLAGDSTIQVVPSGPDVACDALHDGLIHAIHLADRRIWIATPYFVPTEAMMDALLLAARRGIDLRCLVPRRSNHTFADFARSSYLRDLLAAGATLLLHETRMVHAKAGVIDDRAWVGSANMDVRSMLLNFESVIFLDTASDVDAVAAWFTTLQTDCSRHLGSASRLRHIGESLMRLGTPLM